MVDDVTQFQFVGTVQAISERFLLPVLEGLIEAFPFVVQGIHADNGSEYVNHRVAALLDKLRIGELTKSRPRHCNDNALAESKNASVVRKHLGHGHIPRHFAPVVNEFTQRALSPFLNYHRPCLFPTDTLDDKGRVTKRYRDRDVMTPQRPSSSPSTTPSASSNPASPSTSSMPSPTPSATSTPPTRSTTPATHCSAPSGAPGALRPDLPSHPRNPTARPCPGGGPPWGGPLPTAPTARLSCPRRLNLRVPDRSGLAQVLRALQHRPSIHPLPNSDYGSFYLPPSGSSSYWKRLVMMSGEHGNGISASSYGWAPVRGAGGGGPRHQERQDPGTVPGRVQPFRNTAVSGYPLPACPQRAGQGWPQEPRSSRMSREEAAISRRPSDTCPGQIRVVVGPGGRVVVPAAYRDALGIREGSAVFMRLEGEELHMVSDETEVRRVREMIARYVPEGVGLVDDLIRERRREIATDGLE